MRTAHGEHQSLNHFGAESTPSTHRETEWAGETGIMSQLMGAALLEEMLRACAGEMKD